MPIQILRAKWKTGAVWAKETPVPVYAHVSLSLSKCMTFQAWICFWVKDAEWIQRTTSLMTTRDCVQQFDKWCYNGQWSLFIHNLIWFPLKPVINSRGMNCGLWSLSPLTLFMCFWIACICFSRLSNAVWQMLAFIQDKANTPHNWRKASCW